MGTYGTHWSIALAAYVIALRAAGRSPNTIRLHRHYLGLLADRKPDPWTVKTPDLLEFLAVESWAPETRRSARSVVRVFYRWARGAGYIDRDPAMDLPSVRVPVGIPRPVPEHLVRQLVRHPDPRIGFMAMLAAYAGLRASEIARVHGSDVAVDLAGISLVVTGKGGRVRSVPIVNQPLLDRLDVLDNEWAFPNGYGSHLTPGHVCKLLSQAMPEGWTAHKLRHRMATQAYAGTRDLLAVQQLLGHSRPETTQRYVQIPADAMRRAVASTELAS